MKRTPVVLLCGLLFLAVSARADLTIGSPLVQGTYPGTDYCTGCLFVYAQVPTAGAGQTLVSWSFYASSVASFPTDGNANGAGNLITPMIFQNTGGDIFKVVGIGTTDTSTGGPGIQTYSFGLVSGSAVLAAGDFLGWRDGGTTPGSGNNGTISLDLGPPPTGPGIYYSGLPAYAGGVAAGDLFSFTNATTEQRTYSVEFTATPEPFYFGVLAVGLGAMILVRMRSKEKLG